MAFGRFKVIAGDFAKSGDHQLLPHHILMKVSGSLFPEKIALSEIVALEVASEESVNRLGGALGWGLAGEALLGPVGLLAGLLRGGRRNEVTFVCKLRDGRKFLAVAAASLFAKMREALLVSQFEGPKPGGASQKKGWWTTRKIIYGTIVLVVAVPVLTSIFAAPSVPPAPPPAPGPFTVTMSATNTGGANPIIAGETNLPDGMQMIVSIEKRHGRLMGQSNVVVSGGKFLTETFSDNGSPYKKGIYTVEISSSLAPLEPAAVQAVIGSNGQNMLGKFVIPDTLNDGGKVIDYSTEITVSAVN